MSTNGQDTNQQVPEVMDPEEAYTLLHNDVYAPVFFQKLASDYDVQPRNAEEAARMLKIAESLRANYDADREKTASNNPFLDVAERHLHGQAPQQQKQAAFTNQKRAVSQEVASVPAIAHAVLSMQALAAAQQQE